MNNKINMGMTNELILAAQKKGNFKRIKNLIKNGADPNASDAFGRTPLIYAAKNGEVELVEFLLNTGVDANQVDSRGNSALRYAGDNNDFETMKLLIERGADVNSRDKENISELHYLICTASSCRKKARGIKLLVKGGAHINEDFGEGWFNYTPLMLAAHNGNRKVVKILLDAGADVNAKDNRGNTALSIAKKHWMTARLLKKAVKEANRNACMAKNEEY